MQTAYWTGSETERAAVAAAARYEVTVAIGKETGPPPTNPKIQGRFGGAFVTLLNGKTLRGCIGSLRETDDVMAAVRHAARGVVSDPRFTNRPVSSAELAELTVEVSLLSPLEAAPDPLALKVGVHGVLLRNGAKSGCFLPKVAAEQGWTTEQLLANCCTMKAGLHRNAWREPETEVFAFTATVISET